MAKNKAKEARRLEKEANKEAELARSSRRKWMWGTAATALLTGSGTVAYSYLTRLPTFEDARRDPTKRQEFLDDILSNRDIYGVKGWESFNHFIYDPGFMKLEKTKKERGMESRAPLLDYDPRTNTQFVVFMSTLFVKFGEKPDVYIGRGPFKHVNTLDEMLSLFNNESAHAEQSHTRIMHMGIPDADGISPYSLNLAIEIVSFDKQFLQIVNGKRKVSPHFINKMYEVANGLYRQVRQKMFEGGRDGEFSSDLIDIMHERPTIRYFTK